MVVHSVTFGNLLKRPGSSTPAGSNAAQFGSTPSTRTRGVTLSGGSALLDGTLLAISLLVTDLGAVMGWLILRAVAAVDRRQDQCDERAKETARELTEQRVALALLQGESAAYQHIQAQLARRLKD